MENSSVDFQLLFEESPDVLLVLLPDSPRFTQVAATRARLAATQTTREQTIGHGLFELFPDNPDDPGATGTRNLRASLERVLATRAADTMAVQKYDIRGPDGAFQVRHWSPKNIPILSATGEVMYIFHRVEDVTDLVNASEMGEELRGRTRDMEREVIKRSQELAAANSSLREVNAKLGQLDAAKTAFFSNVSHEFRTPLTLMLGPIEDALADPAAPLAQEQRMRLSLAHDNALRLLKLVNALLDFARLEAGRLRASYAAVDLSGITAELAGMFQSATAAAGVRLAIDCPPLGEPAWIDRDMWEKIVPNLVSNAFKFTLAGEIAVRIRAELESFVLEVSDTGVGIPEAELPRIFERFHRVPGTSGRTHEGSGIGLSLVRELVELHGGRVGVTSIVGRGTTFRVEIPKGFAHLPAEAVSQRPTERRVGRDAVAHAVEAARWARGAQDSAAGMTAPPPPAAAPEVQTSRPRVLVVDDNADLREYVAALLAPTYDVATAPDGLAALAAVRANPPDIVVSDVMMPNLDGLGLVRQLRAEERTASLPVILLSARAGEESAVEGLDSGSDDYLAKPFSARELLARVRTHVALARMRRAWSEELERANRELEAFSYSVSHDLRAPLRRIRAFSQILAQDYGGVLDARGHHQLDHIVNGVEQMSMLIEGLLEMGRVTRGPLTFDTVDLSEIAVEVISDLRKIDPARSVSVDIAAGLSARGDRRLLSVVLVNLLGNAWKFSAKAPNPRIEFGRHAAPAPTFFVRDNGAGFDMKYAGQLFAPFQRLHDANDFEGTGVGLATVQRALARHGGRIWTEAAVGRGATFFFSLPGISA
jgi:signal transduction histidine kinase